MKKNNQVAKFLKNFNALSRLPDASRYPKLALPEYPFDNRLLNISPLYRKSRRFYYELGGRFAPKLCSTMRALSAQDLFKDEIDFSPAFSEMQWFSSHARVLPDAESELAALRQFSDISLFHEQNHRVIWRLLPPPPDERIDLRRYLNFAESLVVTLDLALGDELGKELSLGLENLNVIYRPGGNNPWRTSKKEYRRYLLAVLTATYFILEKVDSRDLLKAVDFLFPGQKAINKAAVRRSGELNEHFVYVTNPNWQELYWQSAAKKLQKIHRQSKMAAFYLPEDPLDLREEFFYARLVFDNYGL